MSWVFVSYRRDDSADVAGRIYDRLVQRYGHSNIVRDVDSIPLGVDLREFLGEAVGRCRVLLAVIGRDWLQIAGPSGGRRLDDPRDFVRLEIEAALQRRIPVIPVLVSGAVMPAEDQLPPPLQALAFRNGIAVRRDPDFHHDMDRLLKSLDRLLQGQASPPATADLPPAEKAAAVPIKPDPTASVPPPREKGMQVPPPSARTGPQAPQPVIGKALARAVGYIVRSLGVRAQPPREIVNSLGMKFVLVPRGTFWMGDRGSQRQVEVPHDFYMGAFPVTQGQWQEIMGSNPSWFSRTGSGADKVTGISDADLKQFPVEQVSWDDAQEFLERLNAREKESGFLYRLPTEAEWEYACRGGASSQQDCNFDFYFGDPARNLSQPTNDLSSEQANFNGNHPAGNAPKGKYLGRTTKVGSYRPNRLGIYDMHGNVWEWCENHSEAGASARVIRGGGWGYYGSNCRVSNRGRFEPDSRYSDLGCRVAAVPSGE
jgi:formylglycine-generating enzyme required for sulfatase activity